MTKFKSGMVTRGTTNLATDTFPSVLIENLSPLLPLDRYLLPLASLNSYLSRVSDENLFLLLEMEMHLLLDAISDVHALFLNFQQFIAFIEFSESFSKSIVIYTGHCCFRNTQSCFYTRVTTFG